MSIVEDIRARLDRIGAENARLNAFIRVDADEALAAARAADQRRADGSARGPLDGLAVAVKDNIAVAGKPWTGGLAGRRDVVAPADAGAVVRLRRAGAVMLGGLNMHEAALGGTTDNAAYGRCINPLRDGYTPGGSSGGSGAAVAAGLIDLALGSDTMGSVRLPAAYCGVFGLKPTFGLIGRSGFVFLSRSLDTIGPLTANPSLLWPALVALAGADAGDGESLPPPAGWQERMARDGLHGLRFAVPVQIDSVVCEPEVLAGLDAARSALRDLGASVSEIDLAGWQPGKARLAGLLAIEAEGAHEMAGLMEVPDAMTPELRAMLDYGRGVASGKLVAAQATVRAAGAACLRGLSEVDGLLLPTAPQRAFAHDGPAPVNQADFTALANFAGCPSVALPVAAEGLPTSVQVVSAPWSEGPLTWWAELLGPVLAD